MQGLCHVLEILVFVTVSQYLKIYILYIIHSEVHLLYVQYMRYVQGLCQSGLCAANLALSYLA
jgi:hypothetical protein